MSEAPRKKNLKEILEAAREEKSESAVRTIRRLSESAEKLEMKETSSRLVQIGERLDSDTFQIIVVGRFNNGKSTLLNALLGMPPGAAQGVFRGPLPTDMNPCTAVLATICYAEKPYVRAWDYQGSYKEWSWQRFLDESMVEFDEQENAEKFQDIRNFELGFPTELCRAGVTLIDSPGTDDMSVRTATTREAIKKADAAIVVYRSDSLAGKVEREFVARHLLGTKTRVFSVVNRLHGAETTKRLRAFVSHRLVTDLQDGPRYDGQYPTSQDIYFVDALRAEEGRFNGDDALVEESGLALLEKRLGEFLVEERHYEHISKFTTAATREGAAIEKHIAQRRAVLQRESRDLDEASEEIRPQLEDVARRRDQIPEIFSRYRRAATEVLDNAFQEMFRKLRRRAPWELRERPLQTLEGWKGKLRGLAQKKKIVAEAEAAFQEIINQGVSEWLDASQEKPGARQVLRPTLEEMRDELAERVGQIEKSFTEIRLYLTGWDYEESGIDTEVSITQRVLGVIAGFLLHDIGIAVGAGAGGWRGAVASFGSSLGTFLSLVALSAAGVPLSWPILVGATALASMTGAIAGSNVGLEKRIKDQVIEALEPKLDEVREEIRQRLENQASLLFKAMEDSGMEELRSSIEAEEQNIRNMLEANTQSREEKARLLTDLDALAHQVQNDLRVLRQIDVEIAQVA